VSIAWTCFGSASPRHSSRKRVAAVAPVAISSGSTGAVCPSARRDDPGFQAFRAWLLEQA